MSVSPSREGDAAAGEDSWTATYPLAGFRDDILGLPDALRLDAVALAGHSLGGHVATVIAQ